MANRIDPFVVLPGEGTAIPGPVGGPTLIKARTQQTGGSFALIENVIPPRQGPPLHIHEREDEMWYVLDGHLRVRLGDRIEQAPAGAFVFVPRGTAHCLQNTAESPARLLVMFTPSGMERFFEEHSRLMPGPIDAEVYRAIAANNWMTVAGPPLAESHPD